MFWKKEEPKQYKYIAIWENEYMPTSYERFETLEEAAKWIFKFPDYQLYELGKRLDLNITLKVDAK